MGGEPLSAELDDPIEGEGGGKDPKGFSWMTLGRFKPESGLGKRKGD